MAVDEDIVRLTRKQFMYLKNSGFLEVRLLEVLDAAESGHGETMVVRTSGDDAEQFRAALTDRLARVGFDSEYAPTSEGEILEELVDRFY